MHSGNCERGDRLTCHGYALDIILNHLCRMVRIRVTLVLTIRLISRSESVAVVQKLPLLRCAET